MNGAQWLVNQLCEKGVQHLFALCGNGLNPLLDACVEADIEVVDARNEQAAAYMADATGRLTRTLGVFAVSSGPGHTNALTGLANSWWDGGPLLMISGRSGHRTHGMDNFQELPQVEMAKPVCKHAVTVEHVESLPTEFQRALNLAVHGRPGPVHLTIPADVLNAPIDPPTKFGASATVSPNSPGDAGDVRRAMAILSGAQRPMMVVGSGAFYAQAWEPLAEFAQKTHIPIFTHIWDRGCVEEAIPEYMGVTNEELCGAYPLIHQADAILTLGARVDYRLNHGLPPTCSPNARWLRVDVSGEETQRVISPEIGIVGDPRSVLEQMLQHTDGCNHEQWMNEMGAARDALLRVWEPRARQETFPIPALSICRAIQPFLDQDVSFLLDGGNIGRWAHMTLFNRHPAHWLTCGASGLIGWGLPGAVAAKLVRPDHPVLLLSGDGSAGFTVTEIETALRFKTPYVAIVAHDSSWGIVADGQKDGRKVASMLGEIRFDKVAEALGARGIYIESAGQLQPAIEEGLLQDTVTVIHVPTQLAGISQWTKRYGDVE